MECVEDSKSLSLFVSAFVEKRPDIDFTTIELVLFPRYNKRYKRYEITAGLNRKNSMAVKMAYYSGDSIAFVRTADSVMFQSIQALTHFDQRIFFSIRVVERYFKIKNV